MKYEYGGGSGGSEKSDHKGFHRDIIAEVENERRETVRKLAQAHDVSAATARHSTDLRLDTSTKLKLVNYWWCYCHKQKKLNLYPITIYKLI